MIRTQHKPPKKKKKHSERVYPKRTDEDHPSGVKRIS